MKYLTTALMLSAVNAETWSEGWSRFLGGFKEGKCGTAPTPVGSFDPE